MDIKITEHAKHRLRQRKISIQYIQEQFNRYFYLFNGMKDKERRKMLIKNGKKYINAIVGKKDNCYFLITVYSEKYKIRT